MARFNDYRALLVSDTEGWHDGSDTITYSFLGTQMPGYYREVDTTGDGENDSWNVGSGTVSFDENFSMSVEQRAMTSLAIQAWNDVANVNLQPGTIERGGDDAEGRVRGNGNLVDAGGDAVPTNDDGSTAYDFSAVFEDGFNFFGTEYDASNVFVNTNGSVSFDFPIGTYTPSSISAGTTAMIAPFWADVDTRAGEPIYVDIDEENDVVTITWENVGYYNQHPDPNNSFQLQLYDRGDGDFDIVFRYEDINWTAGTASGGDPDTGLGGVPAHAGFSAGNGADFFELPQSGNEAAMLGLDSVDGNSGRTGLWVFEVRSEAVAGDIAFGSSEFDSSGLFGFVSDFPNPNHLGDRPSDAGDMWINTNNPNQFVPGVGPIYGHTSWNTYLHEMGHALGLRHPNERPGDADTNSQFTVMSYVPHPGVEDRPLIDQPFSLTPMLWDIEALQELYGANLETRTGDTVYFGDGDPSTPADPVKSDHAELMYQYGANQMMVTGEDGNDREVIVTIWDAGGEDLIDASDVESRSFIDLRPGRFSTIGELENNVAVASAVRDGRQVVNLIEDAWGGDNNDRLTGNNGQNELHGNGGRDRINGLGGADELEGNGGRDRLNGGRGNDEIDGGAGNDRIITGRGSDTIIFSAGRDRAFDFDASNRGDFVDVSGVDSITDFDDLMANHLVEDGDDIVIVAGRGNTLTLFNVDLDDITANDFIF